MNWFSLHFKDETLNMLLKLARGPYPGPTEIKRSLAIDFSGPRFGLHLLKTVDL